MKILLTLSLIIMILYIGCIGESIGIKKDIASFKNKITYLTSSENPSENYFDFIFDSLTFFDLDDNGEIQVNDEYLYVKKASIIDSSNCFVLRNRPTEAKSSLKILGLSSPTYLYSYNITHDKYDLIAGDESGKSPSFSSYQVYDSNAYILFGSMILIYDMDLDSLNYIFKYDKGMIWRFAVNQRKGLVAVLLTDNIENIMDNTRIGIYDIKSQQLLKEIHLQQAGATLGNWSKDGTYLSYVDKTLCIHNYESDENHTVEFRKEYLEVSEVFMINKELVFFIAQYGEEENPSFDVFQYSINTKELNQVTFSKTYKSELDCSFYY